MVWSGKITPSICPEQGTMDYYQVLVHDKGYSNKSTDHGFFREAAPPGCRPGQREVQAAEKLVLEHSGALGCEQRHILNDFLSVDSGQPLSGWFSLKSILPKRSSAFYII